MHVVKMLSKTVEWHKNCQKGGCKMRAVEPDKRSKTNKCNERIFSRATA